MSKESKSFEARRRELQLIRKTISNLGEKFPFLQTTEGTLYSDSVTKESDELAAGIIKGLKEQLRAH